MKNNLKKMKKDYRNEVIEYDDIKKRTCAYIAHLKHGNTFFLRRNVFSKFVLKKDVFENEHI